MGAIPLSLGTPGDLKLVLGEELARAPRNSRGEFVEAAGSTGDNIDLAAGTVLCYIATLDVVPTAYLYLVKTGDFEGIYVAIPGQ